MIPLKSTVKVVIHLIVRKLQPIIGLIMIGFVGESDAVRSFEIERLQLQTRGMRRI